MLKLDESRRPVSASTFAEQIQKALLLIVAPDNLTRFQAVCKLNSKMKGPTVAFLIDVGMSSEANQLHDLFKGWVDLAVWNLVAGRLRPQRLKRLPMVEQLSTWLASN